MLMVKRTVLVADDSQTVRVLTQRALRAAGYEVVLAENGQQAVEMAGLHRPQIVILDIQMPIMDGYEACDRILRLENNLPNLRIIFLTSERGQQLDQLGRQYGAYLPKPFNEQLLLSTMQGLFDRATDVNVCCNTGSSSSGEDSGSSESRCPSQLSLCSE
jgi:CheY-like chemotaxis protein